jgi:hypothetical protein
MNGSGGHLFLQMIEPFFDYTHVSDNGSRFENLVAVSLVTMASRMTETGMGNDDVMHIRKRGKPEIDFVRLLSIPCFQIVRICREVEVFPGNCAVIPAVDFLMIAV